MLQSKKPELKQKTSNWMLNDSLFQVSVNIAITGDGANFTKQYTVRHDKNAPNLAKIITKIEAEALNDFNKYLEEQAIYNAVAFTNALTTIKNDLEGEINP